MFLNLSFIQKVLLGTVLMTVLFYLSYPFILSRYVAYRVYWNVSDDPHINSVPDYVTEFPQSSIETVAYSKNGFDFVLPDYDYEEVEGDIFYAYRYGSGADEKEVAVYHTSNAGLYDNFLTGKIGVEKTPEELQKQHPLIEDQSNYGYLKHTFNIQTSEVNFFDSKYKLISDSTFLNLKSSIVNRYPAFEFENSNGIKGFVSEANSGYHFLIFKDANSITEVVLDNFTEEEMYVFADSLKVTE